MLSNWMRSTVPVVLSAALASAEPPRFDESEFKPLKARWLDAMTALQVPGFSIVVVRGDEVVALDAFGVRNIDTQAPVTPDTMFYIASITKTFNALSAVALAEDGRFDLDAPVRKYLPQLVMPDSDFAAQLTPRDLLCHRYGIESGDIVFNDAYTGEITDERFFRLLASAQLAGQVSYTNVHYTILGRALQAASGVKDWRDLLEQRILKPAGMTRTTGYASRMYADPDVAVPHIHDSGRWIVSPLVKTDRTMHAAGGLGATARDMGQWLRLHINGGRVDGRQVVSAAGMQQILTEQSRLPEPSGRIRVEEAFGLAWNKGTFRGHGPYYSHGGGYVGAAAYVAFMPEQKVGAAIMVNAGDVGKGLLDVIAVDIFDQLLEIPLDDGLLNTMKRRAPQYFARPFERPKAANLADTGLSAPPAAYAGSFEHPDFGRAVVTLERGKLAARVGDLPCDLYARGPDAFTAYTAAGISSDGSFEVKDGKVQAFVLERDSGNVRFARSE